MTAAIRILYVDDEPDLLGIGKLFLEESGDFTVTTALSAPEGIRLLEQEKFDVIISDYQMPGTDGIQFLVEVRKRFGPIPFILFTGRGREEIVIQALNSGADFYLQKGGEPGAQFAELTHKVKSAVKQYQFEEALQKSESQFRAISENSQDFIMRYDKEHRHTYANPACLRAAGLTAEQFIGKTHPELGFPQDLCALWEPAIDKVFATGQSYGKTFAWTSVDGEVNLDWRLFPEKDDKGNVVSVLGVSRDITDRKRAEEELLRKNEELNVANEQLTAAEEELKSQFDTLAEGEGRVRQKLESLIAPEGDIRTLDLGDLIDSQKLQRLMDDFTRLTGMGTAILDTKGKVLVATGWQEICTKFHRVNPGTAGFCTESDLQLAKNMKQGEYVAYKCRNHLWDVVTPLYIGSRHMGNIFTGQFFYDDDIIDESVFTRQAEKFGFDRDEYLAALHRVPIFRREKIAELMDYLVKLTGFLSLLSYSNINLARMGTERDTLLTSLQKSEDKFRTLVENIPQKIFTKDLDSRYVTINENFARDLGISPEEMAGKTDADLFPAELADRYRENDIRVLKTGQTEEFEERYLLKGKETWVRTIKTAIRDKGGNIIGLLGIFWDITDKKRAEEALETSQFQLEKAMDLAHLANWEFDVATGIFTFDDRFYALYGTTAELEGGNQMPAEVYAREFVHPDDQHLVADEVKKAILATDPGYMSQVEHRIIRRDKEIRHIVVRFGISKDENGRTIRTNGVNQDITDRKRAEEEILKSEERFRGLVDTITSGVAIYEVRNGGASGRDYIIKDFNKTALEIEGKKKEDVVGKSLFDLRPAIDEYGLIPVFQQVWETGVPAYFPQKVYIDEKYSNWYENRVFRLQSGEIVAVYDDVTERKQSEEALRESEEKYRTLVEKANEAIMIAQDEVFVFANSRMSELLGVPAGKLEGKPFIDFIWPEDRDRVVANYRKRIAGVTISDAYDFRIIGAGGRLKWVYLSAAAIPWKGKPATLNLVTDITERKLAEETLRESEERYNSLFTNNYSISLLIDPESGMIVDANAAACKYYGYSHEQIRGMGIYEINRIEKERVIRNLKEAKKKKERHFFSTHFLADGSRHNVEIYSGPILVNGKRLFYSIIHDITDRIKAEEELKTSRLFTERALTTTPALIYIYDVSEVRNVYTNRGIFEALGYTSEAISAMGQDLFSKILHPEDAGPVGQHHARFSTLPDSTVAEIEYRMKHADGSWRWLHSRDVVFQRSPDGAVKQILGSSIDITDRKQAEEALKKSEEKYRMLIEQTDEGVWIVGSDYKTTFVNNRLAAMFGYTPQEMIGKQIREFMPAEDMEVHSKRMRERLEGKGDRFEQKFLRKDGSALWVIASVTPLLAEENRFSGAFAMLADITERKLAEEALREANKKLHLLSSITRHDINNQMTALRGYTTMLQRKQPDSSFAEYFQKINAAAERISSMIRFTKEYESIGVTAPVWQDCRTLVDTAAKQAQLGQIIVKNDLPAGTEVFADPLVVKVFYNLMDNAMRYGGKITTIRFSDEEHDGDHVVVCEDDGDGVLAGEKDKIFERGFGKNTGLGLTLSREILDITGITIRETGEAGKGARFEMTVPKEAWRMKRDGA